MTIIEAIEHRQLLGALPCFKNLDSWSAWLVLFKAAYGLPLADAELDIFKKCTGRTTYAPPVGGYSEIVIIVGRQAGKTRAASILADFAALTATAEPDGTETYVVLVSQDQRNSQRTMLSYVRSPFEMVPTLRAEVVGETADTVRLANGIVIASYPCRPASVRGLRARIVIVDELAFFCATDGRPLDVEMLRAVRPCLATTGGKLVVLSSPYAQAGALFDLHRQHFGNEASSTLVWQSDAMTMNPTLSKNYLERMAADDPDAYRSEVLGEFRTGTSTFFDSSCLTECVDIGIHERTPQAGIQYQASADPASGSGKDSFTLSIVHRQGDTIIVDLSRAWTPPFNPSGVIGEIADLLKAYRITVLKGDRYSAGYNLEIFRANGLTYEYHDKNQSDLYLEMQPLVNAGQVRLLDSPELLRELRGLERRRGSSGRDKVDHRSGSGSHDDLAASCAGAIVSASKPTVTDFVYVFMDEGERALMDLHKIASSSLGQSSP